MPKKKKPATAVEDGADGPPTLVTNPGSPATTATTSTKKKQSGQESPATPSSPALVICRNKHWRYISSFHGPWLQLPIEVLETLANANYYMPTPRPVDPAVFFDLVKIRRLVDGATDLAVRAANGVTSSALSNSLNGGTGHQMQALGLGYGTNGGAKLSPERKFRLREQAAQKLSRAYHLDEIATSVATMQSTSTLENVAGLVLQRAPTDPDATYVHFFHEKIPSRQLPECTDLRSLDPILSQRPSDCEPLRTRAIVRTFKSDFEGAVQDLTSALSLCRLQSNQHKSNSEQMQLEKRDGRRRENPTLDERDQPSSTEVQLLFQRAGCYLTLACDHVPGSLPVPTETSNNPASSSTNGDTNGASGEAEKNEAGNDGTEAPSPEPATFQPTKQELDERKTVRVFAKRALRDYMEYLKYLHYSPNLPVDVSDDFTRQVSQAAYRTRRHPNPLSRQNSSGSSENTVPHKVYQLGELFAATPPADLPPYPSTALVSAIRPVAEQAQSTTESVTYHPLLTEALHSLLLCHALIQTSAKELQRHAHMVARLARLADGYPVFHASRSPARADWIEVLRRAENWIDLTSSWESLCAPAPLPTPTAANSSPVASMTASTNALAITDGSSTGEGQEQRQERMRHESIIEVLEDERVNDEASFKAALQARQRRHESDQVNAAMGSSPSSAPKRWAVDDGREYPILTERAEAVARWVREVPVGSGSTGGKRKKKPGTSKKVVPEASEGPESTA